MKKINGGASSGCVALVALAHIFVPRHVYCSSISCCCDKDGLEIVCIALNRRNRWSCDALRLVLKSDVASLSLSARHPIY